MSQESLNEGANQLFVGTNSSQIFLGNNLTANESYVNNSDYDPITLEKGTLMGRIAGTDILTPCISSATDGSEQPVGVLMQDLTIDDGDTKKACICTGGRVAAEKVVLYHPTESLNTQVDGVRYKDLIARNTTIQLIYSDEIGGDYDNY